MGISEWKVKVICFDLSAIKKWVLQKVNWGGFQKCAYNVPTTLKGLDIKSPVSCLLTGL